MDRILLQQYITPVNTIGIDFIDYSYVKPREYLLAKINNVDSPTVPNLKQPWTSIIKSNDSMSQQTTNAYLQIMTPSSSCDRILTLCINNEGGNGCHYIDASSERLDFHDHQTTTLLVGGPLGKDRITE